MKSGAIYIGLKIIYGVANEAQIYAAAVILDKYEDVTNE